MRIAMIGCMVMNREISLLTAKSENIIRVWWLRQGLHDTPDVLRAQLQKTIDEIEQENQALRESQRFQAIVLAYGLQRRDRSAKPFSSDYRAAVR